jgi:hypothetical protein
MIVNYDLEKRSWPILRYYRDISVETCDAGKL